MNIVFQYLTGGGGALSNIMLLLQTLSKLYPEDNIVIVCSPSSDLQALSIYPNIKVVSFGGRVHKEIDRLLLGCGGLRKIAEQHNADIVWSLNIGAYIKFAIPHVLSINNSYQVYPMTDVAKYHPKNSLNLFVLRFFFRQSLRNSAAVIVQTPIISKYIEQIKGSPSCYVVSKAVENDEDVVVEPLPSDMVSALETRGTAFTFLYVSTASPHKNHKLLVDVFDIIAREGLNVRLVLTIKYEELVSLGGLRAKELVAQGFIIPVGWVKKQYLKSLYNVANACLMPSLLESLSSAHLEAMQWGKPQIVADLPYARDLCGAASAYASVLHPEVWSDTIKRFMLDDVLTRQLVAEGHERMKIFPKTWDEVAHKIHRIFEALVQGRSG